MKNKTELAGCLVLSGIISPILFIVSIVKTFTAFQNDFGNGTGIELILFILLFLLMVSPWVVVLIDRITQKIASVKSLKLHTTDEIPAENSSMNEYQLKTTSYSVKPVVSAQVKQELKRGERYKNFKTWVDDSFVNKTIFVLSIIGILVVILVLVPNGIKLIQKRVLIDSNTVYISSDGHKYHLYEDCSNMNEPFKTNEYYADYMGYDRCSKCYSGVMRYNSNPAWSNVAYTMQRCGMFGVQYDSKYNESERLFENYYDAESHRDWLHEYDEPGVYTQEEIDNFALVAIARSEYGVKWFRQAGYCDTTVIVYIVGPSGNNIITAKNGEIATH